MQANPLRHKGLRHKCNFLNALGAGYGLTTEPCKGETGPVLPRQTEGSPRCHDVGSLRNCHALSGVFCCFRMPLPRAINKFHL
jgi:hypothetical protein